MDYAESLDYLYGLGHEVLAAKYGLEGIGILLNRIGRPETAFKSVLVAGTNGKGSTAAMIESIARSAGHRTALYTSPHLVRIEERLRVAGSEISDEEFARLATTVRAASEELVAAGELEKVPTFFEQVTAIALAFFREKRVELATLEVGLGGRLDATNRVTPLVSVITALGLDHQNILGGDIAQIAAEKAAIIKAGSAAVISKQYDRCASEVLMQRCIDVGVLPVFANEPSNIRATSDGRLTFDYESSATVYRGIELGLPGRHQLHNAAAAIEAVEILKRQGLELPMNAVSRGLSAVEWPGRLEFLSGRPGMLLDGAHNCDGARSLRTYLDEFWKGPVTLVFGAMADKDIEGMAAALFGVARTIVLTRARDPRSATGAQIGKYALDASCNVIFTESVAKAVSWARALTPPDGLVCVAGSLHLVGEVKSLLEKEDEQRVHFG